MGAQSPEAVPQKITKKIIYTSISSHCFRSTEICSTYTSGQREGHQQTSFAHTAAKPSSYWLAMIQQGTTKAFFIQLHKTETLCSRLAKTHSFLWPTMYTIHRSGTKNSILGRRNTAERKVESSTWLYWEQSIESNLQRHKRRALKVFQEAPILIDNSFKKRCEIEVYGNNHNLPIQIMIRYWAPLHNWFSMHHRTVSNNTPPRDFQLKGHGITESFIYTSAQKSCQEIIPS
jgi:hypothetical protein